MKSIQIILLSLITALLVLVSCGDDSEPMEMFTDSFDREAMLTDWADGIIIPSFENYVDALGQFNTDKDEFINKSTEEQLIELRASYIEAYKAWQRVAMFNIGKAEEIRLLNFTNVYPTDTESIEENITTQDYNLTLPSSYDEQGFPALDYLLYGVGDSDEMILEVLSGAGASTYLSDLIENLHSNAEVVLEDWKSNYRSTFINNSGSSATASVDKMVNDFLFYYEKYLRAGKIGIPAGVFSGSPIATSVEAPYSAIYSKELFLEGFDAVQDFFSGNSFSNSTVTSLKAYLDYISVQNGTPNIADLIINQWMLVSDSLIDLSEDFSNQINVDNSKMLATYDELQVAVVLLKVDMLQALNIQVDFVDADGD